MLSSLFAYSRTFSNATQLQLRSLIPSPAANGFLIPTCSTVSFDCSSPWKPLLLVPSRDIRS